MTAPIKVFKDAKGVELVQIRKSTFDAMQEKISKLEDTYKVARGINAGLKDLKGGKVSPITQLIS